MRIRCPACDALLRVNAPGKIVNCPKCRQAMQVPREEPVLAEVELLPQYPEPDFDKPAPRPRRPKRKRRKTPVMVWMVIATEAIWLFVWFTFSAIGKPRGDRVALGEVELHQTAYALGTFSGFAMVAGCLVSFWNRNNFGRRLLVVFSAAALLYYGLIGLVAMVAPELPNGPPAATILLGSAILFVPNVWFLFGLLHPDSVDYTN